jgi:UDP-N-acetyl-D-glucosamine dehydrogenase
VGVAYKSNVGDVRESPALRVVDRLHRKGAQISYHDPHVPFCLNGLGPMNSVPLDREALESADCVLILTAHRGLAYEEIVNAARLVVDTRNALRGYDGPHIVRL